MAARTRIAALVAVAMAGTACNAILGIREFANDDSTLDGGNAASVDARSGGSDATEASEGDDDATADSGGSGDDSGGDDGAGEGSAPPQEGGPSQDAGDAGASPCMSPSGSSVHDGMSCGAPGSNSICAGGVCTACNAASCPNGCCDSNGCVAANQTAGECGTGTGGAACHACGLIANGTAGCSANRCTVVSCDTNYLAYENSCLACTAGAPCSPNACQSGTMSCPDGSMPVCVPKTAINNGGACGTNSVCSNGSCISCAGTAVPTITASATSFCPGGSVMLTASSASAYHWSNGATTQSIVISSAGTYTVTTSAANGCTATSAGKAISQIAVSHSSQTFNYTGGVQTFTVPQCITSIHVVAYGAQGGIPALWGYPGVGGLGGEVQATIAVAAASYQVVVGGAGLATVDALSGAGGYNGGGSGPIQNINNSPQLFSSGGGGASDIRVGAGGLADRIVVAGGGGGAIGYNLDSSDSGGAGGGLTGGHTAIPATYSNPDGAGGGGTQSSGGTAGTNSSGGTLLAQSGSLGVGGAGGGAGGCSTGNNPGSGGGGGYYGGGGGCVGPGGGGSGYVDSSVGSAVTQTAGVRAGDGQVIISW